jgi:hypothetical protein
MISADAIFPTGFVNSDITLVFELEAFGPPVNISPAIFNPVPMIFEAFMLEIFTPPAVPPALMKKFTISAIQVAPFCNRAAKNPIVSIFRMNPAIQDLRSSCCKTSVMHVHVKSMPANAQKSEVAIGVMLVIQLDVACSNVPTIVDGPAGVPPEELEK